MWALVENSFSISPLGKQAAKDETEGRYQREVSIFGCELRCERMGWTQSGADLGQSDPLQSFGGRFYGLRLRLAGPGGPWGSPDFIMSSKRRRKSKVAGRMSIMSSIQHAALVACLAASAALAQQKPEQKNSHHNATLQFTVVNEGSSKPVKNAEVILHPIDKEGRQK